MYSIFLRSRMQNGSVIEASFLRIGLAISVRRLDTEAQLLHSFLQVEKYEAQSVSQLLHYKDGCSLPSAKDQAEICEISSSGKSDFS